MERVITCRGIRADSLFKILLIGHAFSVGILMVCMGVFSFFGYETIRIEGIAATGLKGLLAATFGAAVFTLIFAGMNWIVVLAGNWLYTRFRSYNIVIHEIDSADSK